MYLSGRFAPSQEQCVATLRFASLRNYLFVWSLRAQHWYRADAIAGMAQFGLGSGHVIAGLGNSLKRGTPSRA
jgi:hypothetical protein